MIHRGEIVEQAVRQSGISITSVAKRLGKSRRHLYNIFEEPNVSIDVVLQISKVIHYDFTEVIPEIKKSSHIQEVTDSSSQYETEKTVEYWKDKYLSLLERYNELLEQKRE